MDKQTLSNYGWVIILTLVLAVMLALATPFGTYVGDGVISIVRGYNDTRENVMDEERMQIKSEEWADVLEYGQDGQVFFGDLNGDEKVDENDKDILFHYVSEWDLDLFCSENEFKRRADVSFDGKVNNIDLNRLYQYINGWNVDFPVINGFIYGDYNQDGKITQGDVTGIQSFISDPASNLPDGMTQEKATYFLDVNLDGVCDAKDVSLVQRDIKGGGTGKSLKANRVK